MLAAKKAIDTDAPAIVLKSAATGQAVTLPALSDGDVRVIALLRHFG